MFKYLTSFVLIFLCACSTPPQQPKEVALSQELANQTLNMKVKFYGKKHIVPMTGAKFNAMSQTIEMGRQQGYQMGHPGAGIIGGMIAGGIINAQEAAAQRDMVEPLVEATEGIDFREPASKQLLPVMAEQTWFDIREVEYKDTFKRKPKKWQVKAPFADVEYQFFATTSLRSVGMTVSLAVYHPDGELLTGGGRSQPIPVFKKTFTYKSEQLPNPVRPQEDKDKEVAEIKAKFKALSKSEKNDPIEISRYQRSLRYAQKGYDIDEQKAILVRQWTENNNERLNKVFDDALKDIVSKIPAAMAATKSKSSETTVVQTGN